MKIGLLGILLITFILLKVFKVIAWSWLWVLSPLWIPFVLWFVIAVLFGGIAILRFKR